MDRNSRRAILLVTLILGAVGCVEFLAAYMTSQRTWASVRDGLFFAWVGTGFAGALIGGFIAGFGAPTDTETLFTAAYDGRMRDERRRRVEAAEGGSGSYSAFADSRSSPSESSCEPCHSHGSLSG